MLRKVIQKKGSPQSTCRAERNPGPRKPQSVTSRSVTWRRLTPIPEHSREVVYVYLGNRQQNHGQKLPNLPMFQQFWPRLCQIFVHVFVWGWDSWQVSHYWLFVTDNGFKDFCVASGRGNEAKNCQPLCPWPQEGLRKGNKQKAWGN